MPRNNHLLPWTAFFLILLHRRAGRSENPGTGRRAEACHPHAPPRHTTPAALTSAGEKGEKSICDMETCLRYRKCSKAIRQVHSQMYNCYNQTQAARKEL